MIKAKKKSYKYILVVWTWKKCYTLDPFNEADLTPGLILSRMKIQHLKKEPHVMIHGCSEVINLVLPSLYEALRNPLSYTTNVGNT